MLGVYLISACLLTIFATPECGGPASAVGRASAATASEPLVTGEFPAGRQHRHGPRPDPLVSEERA